MTARRTLLAGGLGTAALLTAGASLPAAATSAAYGSLPTVVFVHGAFADSSGWTGVVRRLRERGYPMLAVANPLRGLPPDSAYLASVLASVAGPIVLVGHSYGGFVMTNVAAGNPNVKALVYVAAFAPDEGESIASIGARFPGGLLGPDTLDLHFYPLPDGTFSADAYIKQAAFRQVFCADLSPATAAAMAVTQRPVDAHALEQQLSSAPAWKTIPSWYLVASEDKAISPAAERFMAQRAGAYTVEVHASHVPMISRPRRSPT